MLAKERQELIQNLLRSNGAVTTSELMERFNVSVETVRRDLLVMERAGSLQRVHGGAVPPGGMTPFRELKSRMQDHVPQKRQLCRAAAALVKEGESIAVDAGSTAVIFAEALKERFSRLTVVTYSLDVFDLLKDHREFQVILCGGVCMPEENILIGPLAEKMMGLLHVSKAFLFPTAVSVQHGICNHIQACFAMFRALTAAADQCYILADSSKFERSDLLKQDDMLPGYVYITDPELPEGMKKMYEENGITILTEVET